MGWYDQFMTRPNGGIIDAVYTENKKYNSKEYDGKDDGGAKYQLAGFPDEHSAWEDETWKPWAPCTRNERNENDQKSQNGKKKPKKPKNSKNLKNPKKQGRNFV
jgi:hypothetical protein